MIEIKFSPDELCDIITRYRIDNHLTFAQLAKLIGGISASTLCMFENGRDPGRTNIIRIQLFLEKHPNGEPPHA